ncbi:MAG: hypothetical protein ACI9FG_000484, partial [Crocinitomicaceae bacterium]
NSTRQNSTVSTHAFEFKMTITQRLDNKDELTLPLAKKK